MLPPDDHEFKFVVAYGQVASLAYLLYEHIITLDDEVEVIWSKRRDAWIKWAFLFIRYFGLSAQIVNRALDFCLASQLHVVPQLLMRWYMSQVAVGCALMLVVEVVLMARVYALYEKHRAVYFTFIGLIILEVITMVLGIMLSRLAESNFDLEVYLCKNSKAYSFFGAAAILTQIVILALTLQKYKVAIRDGWASEPIMLLTIRDGVMVFAVLLVITGITVVATAAQNGYANNANSWFISVIACAGCRMIINLQKFAERGRVGNRDPASPTFQLTTISQGSGRDLERSDHELKVSAESSTEAVRDIVQTHSCSQYPIPRCIILK
ncbi:hypothetical protein DFP72DRAFT_527030 [Ephemerocybe angulata]|uniref:DUF6533 domain-containing protein n=1 Tax=Ephemerocybe angulata TaxID=980116 RepID=A0A8H6IFF3_9AGAR|nr:hypothetical protein DFP72DRAFT_527030 [Tulosesus angulatus]